MSYQQQPPPQGYPQPAYGGYQQPQGYPPQGFDPNYPQQGYQQPAYQQPVSVDLSNKRITPYLLIHRWVTQIKVVQPQLQHQSRRKIRDVSRVVSLRCVVASYVPNAATAAPTAARCAAKLYDQ
ncbi:uncharacterized protein N7479_011474 [Penicillium vulpinum]|uniref:uncharacterized protein n=1 Tax=Penicillium vulpinum TaxID=29845 RepID=UPI0025472B06|nr:uncharacterized protein N7479_011474 [Penicillium vulpinum]KAJ5953061.1 hypothetical protein N7479_011474 [Penicillium vulpinum]